MNKEGMKDAVVNEDINAAVNEDTNAVDINMTIAIIGGRHYRKVEKAETGVMCGTKDRDLVLVQKHENPGSNKHGVFDYEIMCRCTGINDNNIDYTNVEECFMELINESRRFKSFIIPFNHFDSLDARCSYTVAELPPDFYNKYETIDKVHGKKNFAFHSRVLTVLNLAEAFFSLASYFDGYLKRLVPEAIYVNIEDGDVKIIIDRMMSRDIDSQNANNEYLRLICDEEEVIDQSSLLRFLAYISFRLICNENPYDGKDALIDYPILTTSAYKTINSGIYGFVFSETRDEYSEYIDKEAYQKWNMLPGKIKKIFSAVLDSEDETLGVEEWQKYMRMLRDCLVLVNGQFKLCDPDSSNKVSFLVSNDYSIPIWPRKAVYWYHVGIPADTVEKEVIAGINVDGYIENKTDEQWVIDNKSKMAYLAPGKSIKPEVGMDIEINNTHFKVVNGEKVVRMSVDMGSPPDSVMRNNSQIIDYFDKIDE